MEDGTADRLDRKTYSESLSSSGGGRGEPHGDPGRRRKRWLVGITCIVLVAVIWAGASVLVQYIFEDHNFDKVGAW